jgi:hypothetical protein
MRNAVRRGEDGGNVPLQNYIEISDDEDFNEDAIAVRTPGRQRLAFQHHAQPELSPSPPPNGNGAPHPGAAPSPIEYAQADLGAFIIEDGDELDVNDPALAQLMMEAFNREHDQQAARPAQSASQPPPDHQIQRTSPPMLETRIQCIDQVLSVFPEICRDYVGELYTTIAQSSDFLIAHILDKADNGTYYPKAKDTQNKLKRKRELDEDEEAARKYGSADRVIPEGAAGLRPYM